MSCKRPFCENAGRYTSGYCGIHDILFNEGKGERLSVFADVVTGREIRGAWSWDGDRLWFKGECDCGVAIAGMYTKDEMQICKAHFAHCWRCGTRTQLHPPTREPYEPPTVRDATPEEGKEWAVKRQHKL